MSVNHGLPPLEKRITQIDSNKTPSLPHIKDNSKAKNNSGMIRTSENKMYGRNNRQNYSKKRLIKKRN